MEQFRAVAHISKRKAKWLLENGVIPCEDSGKQTRRFQIRRSEVADFLRRQDTGELNSIIPVGAFNSNNTLHNISLPNTEPEELLSFLTDEWADEPDMLTTKQAADLTGYNDTTINNCVVNGKIQAVNYYGKNLISKESLAEYLASPEGQHIARPSQRHRDMIEAYMGREQNSGMVFGSMTLY
ncbi:MAG: helix-turn-helix domain-containing protein [Peptococcaceae bacterium]|nr:helix-turn-helix domain-containing protein [Peptococcaceae bacterium]MDH7523840.1 helix-turn-helix domain-containing protein [Peptococcaceae bacterium]